MTELNWGIISTGAIAGQFARGLHDSQQGRLHAVASRSEEAAAAFASEHGAARSYGTYDSLLADPDVEAVYIATPHPMHCEWALKAARAKKHILCEKPVGMTADEARMMIGAAEENGVHLMEAFMYRCHPRTKKMVELIRTGVLGEVRMIRASFGFNAPYEPGSRLYEPELGGGGILDVGCYPLSFVRLIAGIANDAPFLNPLNMSGSVYRGQTGVDERAAAVLTFSNNIMAQVSCSISVEQDNIAEVYGSEAILSVPEPWLPGGRNGGTPAKLVIRREGAADEIITVDSPLSQYTMEADVFAECVRTGESPWPAMTPADTLGNMAALEQWINLA